jgi:hypothetical protein
MDVVGEGTRETLSVLLQSTTADMPTSCSPMRGQRARYMTLHNYGDTNFCSSSHCSETQPIAKLPKTKYIGFNCSR